MEIKTATIIGANGALGIGVSSILASFGNVKVYMIARNMKKAQDAIEKAGMAVKANSICKNMEARTYDDLEKSISKSDIVVETIIEEYEMKKKIHEEINKYLRKNAIASSVTSGISINSLAECYNKENKKRFFGIHFFNPPYNLQLCELIASKYVSKGVEDELQRYLEEKLYRKVVRVKDEPGFLANRIGFQFINKAMQYAEKYKEKGGIDYIDTIIGCFTGRNMPPLYTADFVGLDVHKAIVDNIYLNTNDYARADFKLPQYVDELVSQDKCGIKSKEGLYKGEKEVYDLKSKQYRLKNEYKIKFIEEAIDKFSKGDYKEGFNIIIENQTEEAEICRKMLVNYIIYSILVSKEVSFNIEDCDIAMAEGFNWIPPFSLLELIGKEKLKKIIDNEMEEYEQFIDIIDKCNISSKYRYEKFLKAKR